MAALNCQVKLTSLVLTPSLQVRFRDEFREEFRFVCKWTEMTKELRHRKPSSVSGHSSTKHSNSAVHTIAADTPKRDSEKSEKPDGPPHVNTA